MHAGKGCGVGEGHLRWVLRQNLIAGNALAPTVVRCKRCQYYTCNGVMLRTAWESIVPRAGPDE